MSTLVVGCFLGDGAGSPLSPLPYIAQKELPPASALSLLLPGESRKVGKEK